MRSSPPESDARPLALGATAASSSGNGKDNGTAGARKAKPGNGHGLNDAEKKRKALFLVLKKHASREWDLPKISEVLSTDYGFTHAEIQKFMKRLSLSSGKVMTQEPGTARGEGPHNLRAV
jgi:hypothetical protein